MKNLTKKEALAVEFFLEGNNQTEAVMKAFNCKTRQSARSLSCRVFKKPKVSQALAERQKELRQKLVDKELKFIEIVEKYAPKDAVAKQLADLILSSDKRVSDSALDKYLKLRGEYPPARMVELQYQKQLSQDDDNIVVVLRNGNDNEEVVIKEDNSKPLIKPEEEREENI